MPVAEFVERYYLHDSNIEKINFDAAKKILTLTIDFCFWLQPWYNKIKLPNDLIRVTFNNVSGFEYDDAIAEKIFSDLGSEIHIANIDADRNFTIFAVETADYAKQDDIYFSLKINAAAVNVEEFQNRNFKH